MPAFPPPRAGPVVSIGAGPASRPSTDAIFSPSPRAARRGTDCHDAVPRLRAPRDRGVSDSRQGRAPGPRFVADLRPHQPLLRGVPHPPAGRDGRVRIGLRGRARRGRPPGGDQAPQTGSAGRWPLPLARGGGAGGGRHSARARAAGPRRAGRRDSLPGDGVSHHADPGGAAAGARPADAARRRVCPGGGGARRARGRPPRGLRPPRPQAREHLRRRGQPARHPGGLRAGRAPGDVRPLARHHHRRRRGGHRRVHVARAVRGARRRRRPGRRLRDGRRPLRGLRGAPSLLGVARRGARGAPQPPAPAALDGGGRPRDPAGPRRRGGALPRQGSERSLRLRGRPARGDHGRPGHGGGHPGGCSRPRPPTDDAIARPRGAGPRRRSGRRGAPLLRDRRGRGHRPGAAVGAGRPPRARRGPALRGSLRTGRRRQPRPRCPPRRRGGAAPGALGARPRRPRARRRADAQGRVLAVHEPALHARRSLPFGRGPSGPVADACGRRRAPRRGGAAGLRGALCGALARAHLGAGAATERRRSHRRDGGLADDRARRRPRSARRRRAARRRGPRTDHGERGGRGGPGQEPPVPGPRQAPRRDRRRRGAGPAGA